MGLCALILPIAVEDYREYKSMERANDILEGESGSKLAHDAMNQAALIGLDGWALRFHLRVRKASLRYIQMQFGDSERWLDIFNWRNMGSKPDWNHGVESARGVSLGIWSLLW